MPCLTHKLLKTMKYFYFELETTILEYATTVMKILLKHTARCVHASDVNNNHRH